jgi:hypothetical protein
VKLKSLIAVFSLNKGMTHPVLLDVNAVMPATDDFSFTLELTYFQASQLTAQLHRALRQADRTERLLSGRD